MSEDKINEDGSITVQLSKPIVVFGDEKTEITLREPTGKDFQKIGMIMSFDADGNISIDAKKGIKMAETLGKLPVGSLDNLPYKDCTKIVYAMVPFFA